MVQFPRFSIIGNYLPKNFSTPECKAEIVYELIQVSIKGISYFAKLYGIYRWSSNEFSYIFRNLSTYTEIHKKNKRSSFL